MSVNQCPNDTLLCGTPQYEMYFAKDHKLIDEAHTHQHGNHVILIVCFTNCFILGKLSNQILYQMRHLKWSVTDILNNSFVESKVISPEFVV